MKVSKTKDQNSLPQSFNGTSVDHSYLNSLLPGYLDKVQKEKESISNPFNSQLCKGDKCTKRAKKGCQRSMCFACCKQFSTTDDICQLHQELIKKKESDEKYIQDWINGVKSGKKPNLYGHFEEKFSDSGQTVVIWCFKDFCRNGRWSHECFKQQLLRRERWMRLQRKISLSAETSSRPLSKKSKVKKSKERYDKVKQRWMEMLLSGGTFDNLVRERYL